LTVTDAGRDDDMRENGTLETADRKTLLRVIRELREENEALRKKLGMPSRESGAKNEARTEGTPAVELPVVALPPAGDSPNSSSEAEDLLKELARVEDLSVTRGLARLGHDRDAYIDLLRRFCESLEDETDVLRALAFTENWRGYSVRVRSLKRLFENLGNRFLSDWARDLEEAANRGDVGNLAKQTRSFCDDMSGFQAKLLQTSLMDEMEAEIALSPEELRQKLETLAEACLECDSAGIDVLLDELNAAALDGENRSLLEEIRRLAESFDYEDVIVRCGLLLEALKG
jgi:HPt (histidine-containing phosphotransfer) domain-containing protein